MENYAIFVTFKRNYVPYKNYIMYKAGEIVQFTAPCTDLETLKIGASILEKLYNKRTAKVEIKAV